MADRKIVQCTASFYVSSENGPLVVNTGDLYFADDPMVKGREQLFADVNVKSSTTSAPRRTAVSSNATEEATAAPGRRRSLSRRDDKSEPEAKPEVKDEAKDEKDGEV